ncbi:MAG: hypothetical protein E6L09_01110 [Verrucomicrobia bacterium]|nr:MAG: hypothetical protein E6L09_01110 [Verrucomicrobiota bacterium]
MGASHVQNQIAVRIDLDFVRSLESHRDFFGICARRDDEIILELTLVAVVDQVNAGINIRVTDLGESRHLPPPLSGIITQKVVHPGRKRFLAERAEIGIGAGKLDA